MLSRALVMAIPAALVLVTAGSLVIAWAAKPSMERAVTGEYTTVCVRYAKPRYKAIGLSSVDQPGGEWSLSTTEPFDVSHWDLDHVRESWMDTFERRGYRFDSR